MTYASYLAAACGPNDEGLVVQSVPTDFPRLFAIETEYVLARGSDGSRTIYVERGALGTERAAHALGTPIARMFPSTSPSGGGTVPIGVIVMWGGLLTNIPTSWHLCDGTTGTPDLRGLFIKGALVGADPGAAGGASTHTHTTTQAADHAALAHSGAAVANHVFTQPGAHSNHAFTQPGAHAFTQPTGHSAHVFTQPAGHSNHVVTQPANHVVTQPAAHINHVVTQPAAHADNIAHTHGLNVQGGTAAAITGTHVMTSTATGGSARAITAGDAGLSQGTGASLTHSATAVDAHSAHSATAVDAHSAGSVDAHSAHSGGSVDAHSAHSGGAVDAHSGGAVDAHSAHSGAAVDAHGVTQTSQHAAQSHAGAAVNTVNSEPAYYSLAYIQKVA